MRTLDFQLIVEGHPILDDPTRDMIITGSGLSRVPLSRLGQLWRGSIPNSLRLNLDVGGTGVCVTDDWTTTIFGNKLIDCVQELSAFVSILVETLGMPVSIDLLSAGGGSNNQSLAQQLDREQFRGKIWAGVRYAITLLVGAAAGAGLSALVQQTVLGS